MDTRSLWDTPVWLVPRAVEFQNELKTMKKRIIKYKHLADETLNKSVNNGWRVDDPHKLEGLTLLRDYIVWMSRKVFKEVNYDDENGKKNLRMTSWLNVHNEYGYNTIHNHADSLLSGVIYINTPEGSGDLIFRDPRPIAASNKLIKNANSTFKVSPKAGLSVLFPGYLEHWVAPSRTRENDPRISIAFNVHE